MTKCESESLPSNSFPDTICRIDNRIGRIRIWGVQANLRQLRIALENVATCAGYKEPNMDDLKICLLHAALETDRLIDKLETIADDNVRFRIEKERLEDEVKRLGGPGFWMRLRRRLIGI